MAPQASSEAWGPHQPPEAGHKPALPGLLQGDLAALLGSFLKVEVECSSEPCSLPIHSFTHSFTHSHTRTGEDQPELETREAAAVALQPLTHPGAGRWAPNNLSDLGCPAREGSALSRRRDVGQESQAGYGGAPVAMGPVPAHSALCPCCLGAASLILTLPSYKPHSHPRLGLDPGAQHGPMEPAVPSPGSWAPNLLPPPWCPTASPAWAQECRVSLGPAPSQSEAPTDPGPACGPAWQAGS